VDTVHAVGIHVIRKPARATDPGDENRGFLLGSDIGKDFFHLSQNGVVATTGAPTNILIGFEIFGFEYR